MPYPLIEYADASPAVGAVYDDIMATRKIDWINNFWKAIALDPASDDSVPPPCEKIHWISRYLASVPDSSKFTLTTARVQ